MLYTVDFKKWLILVGGIRMQGFADGEGFSLELDDDLFQKVTGADGDTARARRHGLSGSAKITLLQTSPSNDILTGFAVADIVNNAGVVPLMVKDLLGTTTAFAAYAWVKKPAPLSAGKEVGNREWMLDIANVEQFIGGNFTPTF
jgi:hypothetical protein